MDHLAEHLDVLATREPPPPNTSRGGVKRAIKRLFDPLVLSSHTEYGKPPRLEHKPDKRSPRALTHGAKPLRFTGGNSIMIYSSACGYAIRALSWLAIKQPTGYMLTNEICEVADLPRHFIAKIFQDLVRRGLLVSAKGRGGGFALARPAEQITLLEIVEIIDGTDALQQCVVGMAQCDDNQSCPQHDQWKPIRNQVRTYLEQTTLQRMADTLERKLELTGKQSLSEPTTADNRKRKSQKKTKPAITRNKKRPN